MELPFPSPGDLSDPGIEPASPSLQANSLLSLPANHWLMSTTAAAAKSLRSCLTLCDPIDGSPPGSPVVIFPCDFPGRNTKETINQGREVGSGRGQLQL